MLNKVLSEVIKLPSSVKRHGDVSFALLPVFSFMLCHRFKAFERWVCAAISHTCLAQHPKK